VFLDAHGTLNDLAFLGAGLGVVVVGVGEDHGVSTDHLQRFVVSGVDNALLGGGTGHDGARSLLERSGELHDLGVPFLVRDVSLSVLRDLLLSGRSPGGEGGNVGHVLVVHGEVLVFTSGLALLVKGDLLTTGVSSSAPELDNLLLGGETLGVGLLVGELVEEVFGAFAHLGVEHVSLHGGGESDVADKLGRESSGFLGSSDDSHAAGVSALGSSVSSDGVTDEHSGSEGSLGTDSVMLSHNSLSDLSVLGTSDGVSFADSEHTGLLLGETDKRSRLFSHPGSLGSVSLEGDTNLTSDGGLGLSEVFGGDSGVLGKHILLHLNLSLVLVSGNLDMASSDLGESHEVEFHSVFLLGEEVELDLEVNGLLGSSLGALGLGFLVLNLLVDSSHLLGFSRGDGLPVADFDLEGTGNSLEVRDSLDVLSVHLFGVSTDIVLFLVDELHLDHNLSLGKGLESEFEGKLLLSTSVGDSLSHLLLHELGHLLGSLSEGNVLFVESDSLLVEVISKLLGSDSDLGGSDGLLGDTNNDLVVSLEVSHTLGGSLADLALLVVDGLPFADAGDNLGDFHLHGSVNLSLANPDRSSSLLLDGLVLVVELSVLELLLQLSDSLSESNLGSIGGHNLVLGNKLLEGNLQLEHDVLGLHHSLVLELHLDGPVNGLLDVLLHGFDHGNLSSDGTVSLVLGVLALNDSKFPGLDGEGLSSESLIHSEVSSLAGSDHLLPESVLQVSVLDGTLQGNVSSFHGSSGKSSLSSVLDHLLMGVLGTDVGSLHLLESEELSLEGLKVCSVSNSLGFLGSSSEDGSLLDLVDPSEDNADIVGNGDFHGLASLVSESEGVLGSLGGSSELLEGVLVLLEGSHSSDVHSLGSELLADGLSLVMEGLTLSGLAGLDFTGKFLLSSDLEVEGFSQEAGSLGESLDGHGSNSFSLGLGLEGTSGLELGGTSSTDSRLLSGESGTSSLDSG